MLVNGWAKVGKTLVWLVQRCANVSMTSNWLVGQMLGQRPYDVGMSGWSNVGPLLAQRWINVIPATLCQRRPAGKIDVGPTLYIRRWPNVTAYVGPTLAQRSIVSWGVGREREVQLTHPFETITQLRGNTPVFKVTAEIMRVNAASRT